MGPPSVADGLCEQSASARQYAEHDGKAFGREERLERVSRETNKFRCKFYSFSFHDSSDYHNAR